MGDAAETSVTVGLPNGATRTSAVFRTVNAARTRSPLPFDFGEKLGVPGDTLIESDVIEVPGHFRTRTVATTCPASPSRR